MSECCRERGQLRLKAIEIADHRASTPPPHQLLDSTFECVERGRTELIDESVCGEQDSNQVSQQACKLESWVGTSPWR